MFLLPALAALLQAASFTLDKAILSIKNVTYKVYTGVSFPLIALFTFIIFLLFHPPLSLELFQGKYLFLILISIILSIITNIIFYRALKADLLTEIETISLIGQIPTIILASLFFISERNPAIILLSIFAVLTLVWSHWEKHHFHIAKKTWPFLIWTLAIAPFSGIISKELLSIWNPISLNLIRDIAMAIVFLPLYFKNVKHTPRKAIPLLLLTNLLTTIAWILYFFSYQKIGIIQTMLIFALQPILVYFSSLIILKEKPQKKKIIAFIIILISIGVSQFI